MIPAPNGVCFEWWDHGKCATKESGVDCKWPHVRATQLEAAKYIELAKIATK